MAAIQPMINWLTLCQKVDNKVLFVPALLTNQKRIEFYDRVVDSIVSPVLLVGEHPN